MARPSKYKEEYADQAYKLCLLGATDEDMAKFFEVDPEEIEEWIETIEEFKNAIIKAWRDYPEYIAEKEKDREERRKYRKQAHIRKQANEYMKEKVKTDPHYKLRFNISSLIRARLKSKNKTGVFTVLGCTVQELMNHIEKQFKDGMSWKNYGKVWHIDHIKPDSWFKYETMDDAEFKECWALSNLQPLFITDNLRKGNRYAG
jgi:hypothetical protein